MCEDVEEALRKLTAEGAAISTPVSDEGWGRLAEVALPGGTRISLYEPRHPVAYSLD